MEVGLFQKDVAKMFRVSEETITNWENGRSIPQIQFYPVIVSFLGFSPFRIDTSSLGGRIKAYRYEHGLSHKKLGKLLGVDASTVASWELGEFKPHDKYTKKLEKLLIR